MVKKIKQKGFIEMIDMIMVLVVTVIIISISVMSYDGSKTRGVELLGEMNQIAVGIARFKDDTGCYPVRTASLYDVRYSDENYCDNKSIHDSWKGPYIENKPRTVENDISISKFNSTGDKVSNMSSINLPLYTYFDITGSGEKTKKWVLVAERVSPDVINALMEVCNGYEKNSKNTFKKGKCVILPKGQSRPEGIKGILKNKITETTSNYSVGMVIDETM